METQAQVEVILLLMLIVVTVIQVRPAIPTIRILQARMMVRILTIQKTDLILTVETVNLNQMMILENLILAEMTRVPTILAMETQIPMEVMGVLMLAVQMIRMEPITTKLARTLTTVREHLMTPQMMIVWTPITLV